MEFPGEIALEVSELNFHPPVLETDNYDVRECLGGEEKVGAWERNVKRKSRGRNNLNRTYFHRSALFLGLYHMRAIVTSLVREKLARTLLTNRVTCCHGLS